MKNLAIITARSGSKGVPHKNVRLLNGKPLMAYTIEAAINSELFDEIHISTDSSEYADIAIRFGASVPFLRSIENSSDEATSIDVILETLKKYAEKGKWFDTVALLQPTSPLRDADDVIGGYKVYSDNNANSVVSVCEAEHSPLLCNNLDNDLSMYHFIDNDILASPRQKLEKYYRINGALYIIRVIDGINIASLYDEKSYAYIMPQEKSVDIDTELDFRLAETLIRENSAR